MLAQPPESKGGQQWITYDVSADGKPLAKGESGVWILGTVDIDVPVQDARELALTLTTDSSARRSLFLAHARIVTADGKEIPLDTPPTTDNIDNSPRPGRNYDGGPIKIAGLPYSTCSVSILIDWR